MSDEFELELARQHELVKLRVENMEQSKMIRDLIDILMSLTVTPEQVHEEGEEPGPLFLDGGQTIG